MAEAFVDLNMFEYYAEIQNFVKQIIEHVQSVR